MIRIAAKNYSYNYSWSHTHCFYNEEPDKHIRFLLSLNQTIRTMSTPFSGPESNTPRTSSRAHHDIHSINRSQTIIFFVQVNHYPAAGWGHGAVDPWFPAGDHWGGWGGWGAYPFFGGYGGYGGYGVTGDMEDLEEILILVEAGPDYHNRFLLIEIFSF